MPLRPPMPSDAKPVLRCGANAAQNRAWFVLLLGALTLLGAPLGAKIHYELLAAVSTGLGGDAMMGIAFGWFFDAPVVGLPLLVYGLWHLFHAGAGRRRRRFWLAAVGALFIAGLYVPVWILFELLNWI